MNLEYNLDLYRDDGLIFCEGTPRHIEQNKRQICNFFRKFNLSITIEANKKVVNFLDVTFNLNNQSYKPYTKQHSNQVMLSYIITIIYKQLNIQLF